MKLGIHQPYFFPYIGYWQLMNAVDEYVIADNLNYMKQGYINRNQILMNGEAQYFRIPVHKPSQNKLINETEIAFDENELIKMLNTIQSAYAKAPNFESVYEHVKNILEFGLTDEGKNIAVFLENAIRKTAAELGIKTPIYLASKDVILDGTYKREHYVVESCKNRGATEYYNAIGGTKLYCQKFFRENGLGLKFLKAREDITYTQLGGKEFVPNLSIIDIMMFCTKEQIAEILTQFTLEDGYESFEEVIV
ncbi:WbqC family protein [Butyrivibrio sp. AD3002]|uniref:WbqC family protein n=1 Tax=Butyrivibrio sp. AD3002 TaxID=1280670 RepID=UPI0003B4B711|nr:WbqC family protein [Butyrivibrio sp. AD3002]